MFRFLAVPGRAAQARCAASWRARLREPVRIADEDDETEGRPGRSRCKEMAEVAVPRELFAEILDRIQRFGVRPPLVQHA